MKFALFILASWTEKDAAHQRHIYEEDSSRSNMPKNWDLIRSGSPSTIPAVTGSFRL